MVHRTCPIPFLKLCTKPNDCLQASNAHLRSILVCFFEHLLKIDTLPSPGGKPYGLRQVMSHERDTSVTKHHSYGVRLSYRGSILLNLFRSIRLHFAVISASAYSAADTTPK